MKLIDAEFVRVSTTRVKRHWWIVKSADLKLVWFGHDLLATVTRAQLYLGTR